jgi:hypothetical protein
MTAQVPAVEALNFWVSITHRGVAQIKLYSESEEAGVERRNLIKEERDRLVDLPRPRVSTDSAGLHH